MIDQFSIPHSRPMHLIDRIDSIDAQTILAQSHLAADTPFLIDSKAPAFFCVEIIAQASGILFSYINQENPEGQPGVIAQLNGFHCLETPVFSGDQLSVHSENLFSSSTFGKFRGKALRDNTTLCSVELTIVLLAPNTST